MKINSKVRRMGKERKVVEIPKSARKNFKPGEEVTIEKSLPRPKWLKKENI